ncbi:MAG: enoyl-CoA hydratase-related protein, partial [Acidimicrobiales bacterium]|nr:enoyl-CoA hydratase-related protein [Acidimicrobiales bacterium]
MTTGELGNGTILTAIVDGVGVITLNRPEVRNALSSELLGALPVAMLALDQNPDVDVLVLTGTDPAFCAGLDLRELGDSGGNINPDSSPEPKGPFP